MKLIGKLLLVFFKYFAIVPALIFFIGGTILSIMNKSFVIIILTLSLLIGYLYLIELSMYIGKCGFEEIWNQFGVKAKPDFVRSWKLSKIALLTSCVTALIISFLKINQTKNLFYILGALISTLLFYLVLRFDNIIYKLLFNKKPSK
ncbi:hypothetical protein [Anaerocellum danielii]|uniref:Uncharacterized protein n=1 Tax=Anaerocellum danielii TaxID=1387557 RepID=A0ABZ0U1G1_9FIRM|nr:hypothetical protein [Caldicellulosiruptor danielii]WPX09319.1 hypothetical protein SOJ16_000518 [Caldicellulosiruptor danielii]